MISYGWGNAAVGTGFTKSEHYVWGVENARELVRMYWADNNISFVKYSLPQGIADFSGELYSGYSVLLSVSLLDGDREWYLYV